MALATASRSVVTSPCAARVNSVTSWPCWRACRTTSRPVPPVAPKTSTFMRRSRGDGFEDDADVVWIGGVEVELLEPDDAAVIILHQNDFIARLFDNSLPSRVVEPHCEGVAIVVVKDSHRVHIVSPSLIASVG